MKNYILLICFMMTAGMVSAQMKVFSTGDIVAGDNAGITTPKAILEIQEHTLTSMTAKIGSFGIQSHNNTNGFIGNNGFWNGSAFEAYEDGEGSALQYFNGKIIFWNAQSTTAGSNFALSPTMTFDKSSGSPRVGINVANLTPAYTLEVNGTAAKSSGGSEWTISSDKRLKKNIKKYEKGLDILMQINPVEYEYNGKGGTIDNKYQIGALAQDMKKILPSVVGSYKFKEPSTFADVMNGDFEKNGEQADEYLNMNPSALKWITINAVKEQQSMIEDLEEANQNLRREVEDLKKLMAQVIELQKETTNITTNSARASNTFFLEQNSPNPFQGNTQIKYSVEQGVNSEIVLSDLAGRVIKKYNITSGSGVLKIDEISNDMNGTMIYSLYSNGKLIDSKIMSVVR